MSSAWPSQARLLRYEPGPGCPGGSLDDMVSYMSTEVVGCTYSYFKYKVRKCSSLDLIGAQNKLPALASTSLKA